MKYKPGDFFWLLPAPINPLLVKVKVLAVDPKGYVVDEPVGFVNNDECVYYTRTEAELTLKRIYAEGIARNNPKAPKTLESLREMLAKTYKKRGMTLPEMVEKKRGEDWFNIEDI